MGNYPYLQWGNLGSFTLNLIYLSPPSLWHSFQATTTSDLNECNWLWKRFHPSIFLTQLHLTRKSNCVPPLLKVINGSPSHSEGKVFWLLQGPTWSGFPLFILLHLIPQSNNSDLTHYRYLCLANSLFSFKPVHRCHLLNEINPNDRT